MLAPDPVSLTVIILCMLGCLILVAILAPICRFLYSRLIKRMEVYKIEKEKKRIEREEQKRLDEY